MASIVFDDLSFAYPKQNLLFRDLKLRLNRHDASSGGHLVAIMGPSGTGKTTLLSLICGIESPLRGSVTLSPAQASVSYLQQQPVLFEHLSRTENARYFESVTRTRTRFDEVTFSRLVAKLKLAAVLKSASGTNELSGGERQRLSLLRALSIKPQILLLDEPCTGLDTDVKLEFLHMLREVVDELQLLAVYVTHHLDEAELVADELLYLGKEQETDPVTAVLLPIQRALDSPPSPAAALGSMGPGANRLRCTVGDGGLLLSRAGTVLGKIVEPVGASQDCLLVFPATTVRWGTNAEGGVRRVGRSAGYSFAISPETDKLIGPGLEGEPSSFTLLGPAVLFAVSGNSGIRVTVSE